MSFIRDLLKHGLPAVGAVAGGTVAARRSSSVGWTIGGAAAGWGVGWLTHYIIDKAASPSQESIPMNPGSIGAEAIEGVAVPNLSQLMAEVGEPPNESRGGEPKEESSEKGTSVTPLRSPKQQPPKSGFDTGGSDPFGGQGSE